MSSQELLRKHIQLTMLWLLQKVRRSPCTASTQPGQQQVLKPSGLQSPRSLSTARRRRPERRRSSSTPLLQAAWKPSTTHRGSGASFSARRTGTFFTLAAPLPTCSSCCYQSQRLPKSKPLLGCTFALPRLKHQKVSAALCSSILCRVYHCPLCSSKHKAGHDSFQGKLQEN